MPQAPPRTGVPDGPVSVQADWDDIDAAISRAGPLAAVARLSASPRNPIDATSYDVTLLAADDQIARVVFASSDRPASSLASERPGGPVSITIRATFGQPNDPRRAAALVALIAAELRKLAGRDTAPR
ncbi:MAG: hypothetical protein AAFR96_05725 [Planctomycetota bacterium]